MKKAFITGITGQDGSYLAELLLEKKYEVHAILRRSSSLNTGRINHIFDHENLHLQYGDLVDANNISNIITRIDPDEIYNLGAQSHVQVSFEIPEYSANVDALGTLRILDAIKNQKSKAKFYQASSSELYGLVQETPQTETTPFYPRSPYAVAKLYAYWVTINYRESFDMFACNGILFNHESERRGVEFVTRKISLGVANIYHGNQDNITLGNLDSKRDWGYAPDYVKAMWLMLQQNNPNDYVIATGKTHSIKDFLKLAFKQINIIDWEKYIQFDSRLTRPSEIVILRSNSYLAKKELGWEPKTSFNALVKLMVKNDIDKIKKESH